MPKPTKALDPAPLAESLVAALASIVTDIRPAWDQYLVASILRGHRTQATAADLVRTAVDVAEDRTVYDPRAIGWSLRRHTAAPLPRCRECGQTADRCARRPGRDDDHEFTP